MASIQKSATLLKRVALANWVNEKEGLNITTMLNGPHGIGKSMIIRSVAKDLGGYCFTIEGGSLKEGEITGLPFACQNDDGSSEVRFIRYNVINKIWQLEKYYYDVAKTTGFLNGTIKLEQDAEGNTYLVNNGKKELVKSTLDAVKDGEENRYKFGAELDGKTKLKLIESGEIKPVLLFFDELNRTEMQTMKEMMNIILNKSVNGYDLPWWVDIVSAVNPCSQNSSYATNELDDAQLDRFLKIKVDAKLDEWTDYAFLAGINPDIIEALVISENIFIKRESGQEDTSEMTPSPRSWEMVAHLYSTIHELNNTKFFTPEERKGVDDDLRVLIRGKVGETAARTLLENINRKENNIKPQEILTGKALTIDKAVRTKFEAQKRLTQKVISDNVVNYLNNVINEVDKKKTSADEKQKAEYMNFMSQLKEFLGMLDTATQILFIKKLVNTNEGKMTFKKVSRAFAKEVLASVTEARQAIKELSEE